MTSSGPTPVSDMSLQRRMLLFGGAGGAAALVFGLPSGATAAPAAAAAPPPFDFDTGNFIDFFQPSDATAGQSPSATIFAPMDVTIFLWFSQLTAVAWFDAVAPYHPTAKGIYTKIRRRPSSESATNRNMNIALIHAQYQVVKGVVPEQLALVRQMMIGLGLNPDDESVSPTSPVGIGNLAGKGVVAARRRDGINFTGDVGRRYNPRQFADYTGYRPVNTAFKLSNPTRWQPQLTPHRRRLGTGGAGDKGIFTVQHFVTPQMRLVKPYTFDDPRQFYVAPPDHTSNPRSRDYKRAVDEMLAVSAALTDSQKVKAEFFDNKILGIGHAAVVAARAHPELGIHGWAHLFLLHILATFEPLIAAWHQKAKYDAVRPFSAIRYVYGNRPVTSWGGVGKGTVTDMPADQWASYLPVADHPEYPSGSTTLCSASAQAKRRFFDSDDLGWRFPVPAGWTLVEHGITPATDIELYWPTWTSYVNDCAMSRVWGGVHFRKSVERSIGFGEQFGDRVYDFVRRQVRGDVKD